MRMRSVLRAATSIRLRPSAFADLACSADRRAGVTRLLPEALDDHARERVRQLALGSARQLDAPSAPEHEQRVLIAVERLGMTNLVGRDQIQILGEQLGAGMLLHRMGLSRKPDNERPWRAGTDMGQDIYRAHQLERERVAGLLDLLRRALRR